MTTAPPAKGPWIHGRRFQPIGLAYVAAALEKAGFHVEMLDNYLLEKPIDYVKLEIKKHCPEIVGITCSSATYQRCIETAKAVKEMLISQCARFKVDPKCLDFKGIEPTSHGTAKMDVQIKQGIPKETCQKIVKLIKSLKIKVQSTIQDEQVRLTGKKIDDLQEIMRLLSEQDYNIPLQFVNMKS